MQTGARDGENGALVKKSKSGERVQHASRGRSQGQGRVPPLGSGDLVHPRPGPPVWAEQGKGEMALIWIMLGSRG